MRHGPRRGRVRLPKGAKRTPRQPGNGAYRVELLLHDLRPLRPGRYTLEQTDPGHHAIQTAITLR
jgi:hypothetical protein